MTILGLLSLADMLPHGWLLAYFGAILLIPFVVLLILALGLQRGRRCPIVHTPVTPAAIPSDLLRYGQPWTGRLAFLGFPVVQIVRPQGDGDPESVTWHLTGAKDRTIGVFTGALPAGGGKPRFSLVLFTFLSDGRVIVTADRMIAHRPPEHWSLRQRRYTMLERQVQDHRARVEDLAGEASAVLPSPSEITGRLAEEDRAVIDAMTASGDYQSGADGALRPAFSRLPKLALRELAAVFTGLAFPPAHRKDVASTRKENTPGEEEEISPTGDAFKLTLDQMVEQDIRRYRKHANEASYNRRRQLRLVILVATLTIFALVFGAERPWETVAIMLAIIALHEFGRWLAMKWFGYAGVGPWFIPYIGVTDAGRKLHATPWQQLCVIFAGPLPGLLAGMALLAAGFFFPGIPLWLLDLGGLAIVFNAFHLLPFLPLAGGRIVDLLVFRDLPVLRPVFTALSAVIALVAGLFASVKALMYVAPAMLSALIWDIKMIKVVRGGRRLGWAGSINDENEALRRIFHGVRSEENEAFLRSHDWQRQIDVLLSEVLRKRPGFLTRIAGGWFYGTAAILPILLVAGVFVLPLLGDLGRPRAESEEFAKAFPGEKRSLTSAQYGALRQALDATPRERTALAAMAHPTLPALVDKLDWTTVGIAHHCGEIDTGALSSWMAILSAKLEVATRDGRIGEATRRAEVLLYAVAAMEPALTLADRELLWSSELRALAAVEKLAASGKLDAATLERLEARVNGLNKAPLPEVENMLLVGGWSARQAENLAEVQTGDTPLGAPDARFWRHAYPQLRRFSENALSSFNGTPATVALARRWTKSRRVGELPAALDEAVAVGTGEADFIVSFCESHRKIAWRRVTALSALRLEAYRQKSGKLPETWKHSVPGGACLTLVKENGPYLELADRRDATQRALPRWLGAPEKEPLQLDHLCPLFGSPLELSRK